MPASREPMEMKGAHSKGTEIGQLHMQHRQLHPDTDKRLHFHLMK